MTATAVSGPAVKGHVDHRHTWETPKAILVGGIFKELDGLLDSLRTMRSAGATSDVIGFAIPLGGDPTTPEGVASLKLPRGRRRFDVLQAILDFIDPHRPPAEIAQLRRGQNTVLATPILGNLKDWLVGVRTFRVPVTEQPDGGVWVLGRPNHAAAVAGAEGAAAGGFRGALAALGIPKQHIPTFAKRLGNGECIMTTCETDKGRANRDERIIRKNGADLVFKELIFSERRKQT
ncbi:MAG: hypothetical protein HY332_20765 [Chloroflexi bacterium]|nr:hypothetical protein [Chloroflexota bacterium]